MYGADITTISKAEAWKLAIKTMTGETPQVIYTEKAAIIAFSPEQVKKITAQLEKQMSAAPGDVQIKIDPILWNIIARKAVLPAIVLLAIGFMAGKVIK